LSQYNVIEGAAVSSMIESVEILPYGASAEHRILCLKPALRLERQGQHGQNETDKRDHRANLADSSLNKPG